MHDTLSESKRINGQAKREENVSFNKVETK